jgi:hypothetical protein
MFERICAFEGCQNKHQANGLCSSRLWQLDQGKELTPLRGRHGRKHERCSYPGFVPAPEGHPNAKRNGAIFEHVLAMTETLGRPLAKGETVHHKNNIKWDNRPENLELWHVHQPCGASVADTVAWARWFLKEDGETFPE